MRRGYFLGMTIRVYDVQDWCPKCGYSWHPDEAPERCHGALLRVALIPEADLDGKQATVAEEAA